MMDYLVLTLVKHITKCSTTQIRILIASLVGSLMSCMIFILPISYESIKFILFHIVVNTAMIKIGFKIRDKFIFVKCLGALYVGSFLLGGILQYFQQYIKIGSLFFAMVVVSYWGTRWTYSFICYLQKNEDRWYDVEIYMGESIIYVKALLDTGNGLSDPYTGKPVCIVEMGVLREYLGDYYKYSKSSQNGIENKSDISTYRYIPYHAIGSNGVLLAINVHKIHICGMREQWIDNPILAISDEPLSVNKSYQMILNPDIL